MGDTEEAAVVEAARRLHELALEYAAKSHAAQAALVRAFEAEASSAAATIGEVLINDVDDEHLVLTSGGRFAGRVLQEDPTPHWQMLDTPDDVADNYDPVDLFSDVAAAVAETFLDADDDEPGDEPMPEMPAAQVPLGDEAPDEGAEFEESATLRNLRRLHEAGVLSDADFETRKAELHR